LKTFVQPFNVILILIDKLIKGYVFLKRFLNLITRLSKEKCQCWNIKAKENDFSKTLHSM